ncbi:Probable RNA helicase SDE3 [Linum perenne]
MTFALNFDFFARDEPIYVALTSFCFTWIFSRNFASRGQPSTESKPNNMVYGFIKIIGAVVISACLGWGFFRWRDDPPPPPPRRKRSPSPPRAYSRNVYSNYDYTKHFNPPTPTQLPLSSPYAARPITKPSQSSPFPAETPPSSSKPKAASHTSEFKSLTVKPTLRLVSSSSTDRQSKDEYIWVQNGKSPVYEIPTNVECLINQNKVPEVLRKPLSASSYRSYFAALLYAEDSYLKKWSEFQLLNVSLEVKHTTIYKKDGSLDESRKKVVKTFVSFEIDAVPEKRPFLLSRDFVFARLSGGQNSQKFQGLIYRVERSTSVLVEFGNDFLSQHRSTFKYDVSFSFNRVCLKRFHQAIEVASDRSCLRDFIFPDSDSGKRTCTTTSTPMQIINRILDKHQRMAVHRILNLRGAPPYLVEGPLSVKRDAPTPNKKLSRTGLVVKEAVLQLYRGSRNNRILICAPLNNTCDALIESLNEEIKDEEMFRVNAAFRDVGEVSSEILNWSAYEEECFTCPPLHELKRFRVIVSTFVSSFRLQSGGMRPGNFSHIFMVDASMVMEPEVMVAVGNLADDKTVVIVTGVAAWSQTRSVRSDIGRKFGLMTSYFERLRRMSRLYSDSSESAFISRLDEEEYNSHGSRSYLKPAGRG